jgi:hypothetical protein
MALKFLLELLLRAESSVRQTMNNMESAALLYIQVRLAARPRPTGVRVGAAAANYCIQVDRNGAAVRGCWKGGLSKDASIRADAGLFAERSGAARRARLRRQPREGPLLRRKRLPGPPEPGFLGRAGPVDHHKIIIRADPACALRERRARVGALGPDRRVALGEVQPLLRHQRGHQHVARLAAEPPQRLPLRRQRLRSPPGAAAAELRKPSGAQAVEDPPQPRQAVRDTVASDTFH